MMKKFNLTNKVVIAIMVLGLLFTACSNDESVDMDSPNQDYSEVALSAEVDETVAALDDISLDIFEQQESIDSNRVSNDASRTSNNFNNLPDCVTITVVIEQNYREVTIDFGTEGCLVRGNTFKRNDYLIVGKKS